MGFLSNLFGGASQAQKDLAKATANFYTTVSAQSTELFKGQQDLLNSIKKPMADLVSGHLDVFGYGPEEQAALVSSIISGNAQATANTLSAIDLKQRQMSGGGTGPEMTGAQEQIRADVAATGAQKTAEQLLQEKISGYAQGRANVQQGITDVQKSAALLDPSAMTKNAVGAGSSAQSAENTVVQADKNSLLGKALSGGIALAEGGAVSGIGNLFKGGTNPAMANLGSGDSNIGTPGPSFTPASGSGVGAPDIATPEMAQGFSVVPK